MIVIKDMKMPKSCLVCPLLHKWEYENRVCTGKNEFGHDHFEIEEVISCWCSVTNNSLGRLHSIDHNKTNFYGQTCRHTQCPLIEIDIMPK